MNARTRIFSAVAAAASVGSVFAAAGAPAAFADGKSAMGCSSPYTLGSISEIDTFSQPLVAEGFFTEDSLTALLTSLDHNGDGYLCFKTPSGWDGPPATNASQKQGFVNLTDDYKVLPG